MYNVRLKERRPMSAFARRSLMALLFSLSLVVTVALPAPAGDDWLPIKPEELQMTSEPKASGAPAIYLYRQVDRDDQEFREYTYARIKIFTEEGRKYADVEIPYIKDVGDIRDIRARTIHVDGSIVNFDGKAYEKTVVKAKGVKILVKTFTLPDVQTGSIIEYRYTRNLPWGLTFDSKWLLSEELFTKRAKFSLYPSHAYALRVSSPRGLPEGTKPPAQDHNLITMETENVPAFQIEDYMPPVEELKYRVQFIYGRSDEKDPDKFWKQKAQEWYVGIDSFINRRKAMEAAVAQIVAPGDTQEVKLRKIYERTQQFRNTSFERNKTEKEAAREKQKDANSVEDVWKHGYGDGWDITWLFLALARAAGFDASPVLVSTRDEHFFNPALMNEKDLNTNVVLVKLDGKDLYLDPGIPFVPFRMLPWSETGSTGLLVNKDGGSWVTTSVPTAAESRVERRAILKLADTGALEGKLTVTFFGLEALGRRLSEQEEDDTARKTFLEDQAKEYVPSSTEVELKNKPDWNSSAPTLSAEFDLKVPDWASSAGRRTLLPVGLFGGAEKHLFEHAARVHPIYFQFPHQELDDVTIDLLPGWQASSIPKPQTLDIKACIYSFDAQRTGARLHIVRELTVNLGMADAQHYGALRNFFQTVRTADEQQIVVSPGTTAAQN
jgi:hypothetical protein